MVDINNTICLVPPTRHKLMNCFVLEVERVPPYQFIKINWDYRGPWFIKIRSGKIGPRIVKHCTAPSPGPHEKEET